VKRIKVDCCKSCPYLNALYSNTCRHPKAGGMSVYDVNVINEECPLEDANEI
jgi:hypothetical protein